jgi:sulfite exporter TauE/SafE
MAAVAVGLSCGTACSPLVNLFLTTYTLARFNSIRQGFRAFGYFLVGKIAIGSVLALLSAVLGRAVIGKDGRLAGIDLRLVLDGCLILTGIFLLAEVFWRNSATAACNDCGAPCRRRAGGPVGVTGRWALIAMGLAYGLTPCTPRLLFLLMVAMLTPVQAVGAGLVFGIANSVPTLLIFAVLVGFVSPKIQQDLLHLMRVFQITVFSFFIIVGIISLLGHLKQG